MVGGGKVGLVGLTMLRMAAGPVVCDGEVFAMGSLDKLVITISTLMGCYCVLSCLFHVKH